MLAGHAGLAFAARARFPEIPLGPLMASALALDLVWPLMLLTGVEEVAVREGATAFTPLVFTSYPWTHSLAMAAAWAVVAAILIRASGRRGRAAAVVGALVMSHWFLDAVTHVPDLPLTPATGSPLIGMGLWNSVPGTLAVEGLIFAIGVAMYWRRTVPITWSGSSGFWAFVIVIGLLWGGSPVLPPPADQHAVGLVALSLWIIPFWSAWFDRSRGKADGVQATMERVG